MGHITCKSMGRVFGVVRRYFIPEDLGRYVAFSFYLSLKICLSAYQNLRLKHFFYS